MSSHSLSKSQYLRGLQCHKSLWLYKNSPDLRTEPGESQLAVFAEGREVESLGQKLFPDGIKIEFHGSDFNEKITQTKKLIESGVKTIYEATFQYDDVLVMVDILHKRKDGWGLYEIKSSTEPKDTHKEDIAIQYCVLKGQGLDLATASLIHINKKYIRNGGLEIDQLFTIVDLTDDAIQRQKQVKENLSLMKKALNQKSPDIVIGPHCLAPYECDFKEHCWDNLPEPSVFNLSGLWASKKFDLYSRGIVDVKELPKDYKLTPFQQAQVKAEQTDKDIIDRKSLKAFLDEEISYPLYFLDFETIQPVIPAFDGLNPNSFIPFQYSLHWQEHEGGKLEHSEFLAKEGTDPREEFVKKLISDVPNDVCILTYNQKFEKGRLKALAKQFPVYSERIMNIHDHIVDLMIPFQKAYVYKKPQQGSYSIKYVLPAFIPDDPELDYKELKISNGMEASNTYANLHLNKNGDEVSKVRVDLLKYCWLDTYAMVKLLEKLKEIS
jgi:predicted RecB family nuclease